jgi:hypothetical protein
MIVLPQSTRRLLGNLFAWGDLGIVMVPGIAEPAQVWRVLGPGRVASRFEALRGDGVSPLVGRQAEVKLLLAEVCARESRTRASRSRARRAGHRKVASDRRN